MKKAKLVKSTISGLGPNLNPNAKLDEGIREHLGQTLRHIRKITRTSQEDLGKLLNLHQTAVCRVELGSQSLEPWQLYTISNHFGVRIEDFFAGRINYWQLAERFDRKPPFPARYLELPYSKIRDVLPALNFLIKEKGSEYASEFLESLGFKAELLMSADQTIGTHLGLDLVRHLISNKILTPKNFQSLTDQTRAENVHGTLFNQYKEQISEANLFKLFVLNHTLYESNFLFTLEEGKNKAIQISVTPAPHMKDVPYKDEILKDFMCRHTTEYLRNFPKIMDRPAAELKELQCHYRENAAQCIYEIKIN